VPRLLVDPAGKVRRMMALSRRCCADVFRPQEEMDDETWDRVLAINTKGVFLCTQIVVRRMLRDKTPGVVINVASEAGVQGSSGQAR
jgi:NAD(P)-dependent dehydrogenase (short-subunit alcohol dehydrogenase family)